MHRLWQQFLRYGETLRPSNPLELGPLSSETMAYVCEGDNDHSHRGSSSFVHCHPGCDMFGYSCLATLPPHRLSNNHKLFLKCTKQYQRAVCIDSTNCVRCMKGLHALTVCSQMGRSPCCASSKPAFIVGQELQHERFVNKQPNCQSFETRIRLELLLFQRDNKNIWLVFKSIVLASECKRLELTSF